jgi:hypothetical protein
LAKKRILSAEAQPGANFGEVFTASIPNRVLNVQVGEGYYDSLELSFRGSLTGAITLESFLTLVNPLTFIANEPRIQLTGRDAFALSTAFYGQTPKYNEGATGTTDTVLGIRIPLWVKPKPSTESYAWNATRVAVTNVASEVFHLGINFANAPPPNIVAQNNSPFEYQGPGRIDARQIPFTTPGATGIVQVINKLPKLGKLLGLLVFSTTVPTSAAVTSDVEFLYLDSPLSRITTASWADLQNDFLYAEDFTRADATAMVTRQVLQNYGWLDFRAEPIDLVGQDIALSIDAEVTAEATRFIPVIEVPQ